VTRGKNESGESATEGPTALFHEKGGGCPTNQKKATSVPFRKKGGETFAALGWSGGGFCFFGGRRGIGEGKAHSGAGEGGDRIRRH